MSREAASPLLGEMVLAKGTAFWIPTDGNANPDFFTAQDLATSGMKTYALFSASFSGPFTDLLRITAGRPEGMTLAEVYAAIFQYLRQSPGFSGVCAVVLKATVGGVCSSDLKEPVLAAAADPAKTGPASLPHGRSMTEYPVNISFIERVTAVNVNPRYAGDILISIGYGIDPALVHKTFGAETSTLLSYTDPRTPESSLFLYTKGMVFENLPWDDTQPFEEQIRSAVNGSGFVALHNLLKMTTVKSAVAGILPVTEIRSGD
jgi:hypothetical protein